jgi:MobA-like NTP transferase domain
MRRFCIIMKPTLLVLAAGMGSRYGGLKQMDPMGPNGETVLDYSVYDALRAGFGRVVFVIREDFAEAFRQGVGSRFAGRIQVDYAFQTLSDLPTGHMLPAGRTKPWGTAHAVRAARHLVKEPFAVINADDFYGADAYQRAAAFLTQQQPDTGKSHNAMVGYPLVNTLSDHGDVNRGICEITPQRLLTRVEEYVSIQREADGLVRGNALDGSRLEIPDSSLVSMNFWAFTPCFFAALEREFIAFLNLSGHLEKSECYIPTVVDALIRSGEVDCTVLETTSLWFGVTYPDDKQHVVSSLHQLITAGEYPAVLS